MASLGILSGSLSGTLLYLSRAYALSPPVLAFMCVSSSLPCALLVASLGILSGSSLYLFSSFSFLFLPPSSSFLGLPCLLPLPPLFVPSSSLSFSFLSRCLPKVASTPSSLPKVAICRHVGRFSLGATYASQLPRSAVPMRRLCRWRQLCRCMSWTPCSTSLGILLTTSHRMFPTITFLGFLA